MRRRDFISLVGGAALGWPRTARAQQPTPPVIGYLGNNAPGVSPQTLEAFHRGLKEVGYIVGQNVEIEFRAVDGRFDRLPELAADLVRRRVAVIAGVTNAAAVAAKGSTSAIPIVFLVGLDPVDLGLVSSIDRPGGNATGVSLFINELEPKRLQIVRELLPQVVKVAALVNPDNPSAEPQIRDLEVATSTLGLQLLILRTRSISDLDSAFATLMHQRAGALLVAGDPFFNASRKQLIDLAAQNAVPAIYPFREHAEAGGLMSYGTNLAEGFRQVGLYTGLILKGTKPADLPVLRPTKFEFVFNLKTAKALGLTIPPAILLQADEVIE